MAGITRETGRDTRRPARGTGGAAKMSFKGKAELLGMPVLGSFPQPVRAQLRRSGGSTCWETVFSNPPLVNTTAQFKAKSD